MYKALVDTQSLADPSFLNKYEVTETYEECWPGEDPEFLCISKVKIPDDKMDDFIKIDFKHSKTLCTFPE